MKNRSSLLSRTVLTVAGALALGACSRGNYAVLPKAPSYLGTAPMATSTPRPAAQSQPATAAPEASSAIEAPEAVAASAAKPVAAATPAARPIAPVASATPATATEVEALAAPTQTKPTLAQRLVLKKLTKKLDKLASQAPQIKQHDAAAGTERADGGLRQSLVLGIIGLGIILLGALLNIGIIYVIGVIVVVVALVLLLLYLVNQV